MLFLALFRVVIYGVLIFKPLISRSSMSGALHAMCNFVISNLFIIALSMLVDLYVIFLGK